MNRDKAKSAGDELLKLMTKGYPLGKITKSRDVDEPVIKELVESKPMQRIKAILSAR